MITEKTHLYFVPGLAASKEIFRNIKFSSSLIEVHILDWLVPQKGETLNNYSERMAEQVKHENAILAGVSFGGVVAQEMSTFLRLKKLVLISSVKSKHELPARLRWAGKTKAYKLVPTSWALSIKDLTKLAIGPRSKKRLTLYQEYLSVRDKDYLDWAIEQMVCWQREEPLPGIIHIHGNADIVFPIKNIKDATIIEGGTHVMILYKAKAVSNLLEKIIENA